MRIDRCVKKRYFKALDIVHLWIDARDSSLVYTDDVYDICVKSKKDLSKETELICKFISLITGHTWMSRSEKTDYEYKIIFYETCKEEQDNTRVSFPELSKEVKKNNIKKRKDETGKTLF